RKQVQIADIPSFTGTHANRTTICEGDTTMLTGVVTQALASVPFPIPSSTPLALPDGNYVCYTTTINYNQYNLGAVITSAADVENAFVNIWHEYSGDLSIQVICPNGQAVALFNASHTDKGGGTGGRDFGIPFGTPFNYNWNSMGTTPMSGSVGNPVPAGNYIPDQPFSGFIGCPANGVWTLKICDFNDNDEGGITSWGIQLAPHMYSSNSFATTTVSQNWVSTPDSVASPAPHQLIIKPTTSGTHTYTYTTTNSFGCTNDTTITITVNPTPIANFTVANQCLNTASTFVNTTNANSSTIVASGWQFNNTGIVPAPTLLATDASYTFATCNNPLYSATLVSVTDKGCADTITKPVTIYCLPVPNFTVNNGCEFDDVIQFNNTSTNGAPTTGMLSASWYLDTKLSTLTNPTETYTVAGTKNILLIVTDINNCIDTLTKPIQIYPKPVANFTVDSVCLNLATTFANASTLNVPAGFTDVVSNYNWTYDTLVGYPADATTPSTTHVYTLPATEVMPIAALIIKTNNNCYDTITKPVVVWTLPKANYTMTAPCYPNPIAFTNASTLLAGTDNSVMATMTINWGDAQTQAITSLTEVANHNFTASGNYVSELNVVTNHGCNNQLQLPITIHAKPVADYVAVPLQGCSPVCVTFTNTSTQNQSPISETISTYNWTFGDYNAKKPNDDKATSKNTSHCYNNTSDTTQLHSPQLIVITNEGCADTLIYTDSVVVYPLPKAEFTISPEVTDMLNPDIKITDESHLANTITWNYGNNDQQVMNNANPLKPINDYLYTYTDSGTYIITQLVLTNNGCRDSASNTVQINPIHTVFVPNAFSPDGDGLNDFFMVRGTNIKTLNLIIFNRWGDVVARINDVSSKGWDGTDIRYNTLSELEVYNWKLEYTDVFNTLHRNLVGTITLIK
ncbi:MAG: gliding motility-associated C-terminal domain-containing protein, partial [Bacteroidia bacterium]